MMSDYMKYRQQHILSGRPLKKSAPHPIAKKSEKRKQKEKEMMHDDTMVVWFEDRRKEMTGICQHCGGKSCKDDDKLYKHSIAHILPKALFPSVAHHPSNWIELCFFGSSCHTNMDSGILDMTEMNCWDTIVTRFQEIYTYVDQKEKKKIPDVLKQYIEVDL
jgi:hypothetical protein